MVKGAKYSYLSDNYLSGVSSFVVTNSDGFSADDYILLGEFGSETSEILKINTVTAATHTITPTANTKFAHSESTKITIIKYNQVKFYWTAVATFDTNNIISTTDIQADSLFTLGYDTSNTTGFGWFLFYNETTVAFTQASNAIPYAGFSENSVKKIFDTFYSLLNNKESKLITNSDAFSWLNEAYSIARNELNLVNKSYFIEDKDTVTTTSGTQEYALETAFSGIVSVYDADNDEYIDKIDLSEVDLSDYRTSSGVVRYYIRGNKIGFSPAPTETVNYYIKYKSKSTALTSYYDNVDLPDNNFYCLVDYMMYRAAPKLNRSDATSYYEAFKSGIERLKVVSHKREGGLDSWSHTTESLV